MNSKYWPYIIIGLAAAFLLFYYFRVFKPARAPGPPVPLQNAGTRWETQTNEEPPVLVKVTPLQLGADQNPWKFEVTFTTHSGDLNIDVGKTVILIDDKGNSYQPASWEGPGPGGHHISGSLIFTPISNTKSVELKIRDVGGIPERSFRWNLK